MASERSTADLAVARTAVCRRLEIHLSYRDPFWQARLSRCVFRVGMPLELRSDFVELIKHSTASSRIGLRRIVLALSSVHQETLEVIFNTMIHWPSACHDILSLMKVCQRCRHLL